MSGIAVSDPGWPVDPASARTDRLLIVAIAAWALLVGGFMAFHAVPLTPDVALIALGLVGLLAVRRQSAVMGRLPHLARELIPLAVLLLAYELMRGYAASAPSVLHTEDIVTLERSIFLGALPTALLQQALHPATGVDLLAAAATVLYFLHFALPVAVATLLWVRDRTVFHDFIGGLIVLSIAGFATYLLLPVAPPWYAAQTGSLGLAGSGGPIEYLKQQGFDELASLAGLDGNRAFDVVIHDLNPNVVGAFPSLHAGYPVLAFIALRRAFGRPAWWMLAYGAIVWLAVIYLGDHFVLDVVGGIAYAGMAAWVVARWRPGSQVAGLSSGGMTAETGAVEA